MKSRMNPSLLFVVFLLAATSVSGTPSNVMMEEPSARAVKFYPPDQIPAELSVQNISIARQAVVKFVGMMGGCSGVYISNDGYLLTAMHCFEKDLLSSGAVEFRTLGGPGREQYLLNPEKLRGLRFSIVLGDKEIEADAVAAGPGFLSESFKATLHKNQSMGDELRAQGFDYMGDFMIIKIHSQSPTPCLMTSFKEIKPGDILWTLGYPVKSERGDGFDSSGKTQYLSFGKITTPRQNACLTELYYSGATDDFARLSDWFFNNPGTEWTDLDILAGSSGAPVLDSFGRIVGLVTRRSGGVDHIRKFCGAANFTRLASIRKMIDQAPGGIPSSRLFSCGQDWD